MLPASYRGGKEAYRLTNSHHSLKYNDSIWRHPDPISNSHFLETPAGSDGTLLTPRRTSDMLAERVQRFKQLKEGPLTPRGQHCHQFSPNP